MLRDGSNNGEAAESSHGRHETSTSNLFGFAIRANEGGRAINKTMVDQRLEATLDPNDPESALAGVIVLTPELRRTPRLTHSIKLIVGFLQIARCAFDVYQRAALKAFPAVRSRRPLISRSRQHSNPSSTRSASCR